MPSGLLELPLSLTVSSAFLFLKLDFELMTYQPGGVGTASFESMKDMS